MYCKIRGSEVTNLSKARPQRASWRQKWIPIDFIFANLRATAYKNRYKSVQESKNKATQVYLGQT